MENSVYKRFLSYIYAYNGEVRMRNTGFAKVEVKNGQCKIQVSLQRIAGQSSRPMEAFAFVAEESEDRVKYHLLPLGRIYLRNGNGELRCMMYESNISGSDFGLEELEGILVKGDGSRNRFLMTLWKHDHVDLEQLLKAQVIERKVPQPSGKNAIHMEVSQESVAEAVEELEKGEETLQEVSESTEVEEKTELTEGILEAAEELSEVEKAAEVKEVAEAEETEVIEDIEEAASEDAEDIQEDTEKTEEKDIERKEENVKAQAVHETQTEQNQKPVSEMLKGLLENQEIEQVLNTHHQVEEDGEDETVRISETEDCWQKLCRQLPHMRLPGCCQTMEVLRIQPSDLGKLPKKNWIYGSNSFLLQSYCRHRHLILFCCKEMQKADDNPHYYLGVPSTFPGKERMMASMFGFPYYLSTGRSGYWYTEIQIGESCR